LTTHGITEKELLNVFRQRTFGLIAIAGTIVLTYCNVRNASQREEEC